MKNFLFEAYLDFCASKSYADITNKIIYWAEKIFGYDKLKIMFMHGENMICYDKDG